MKQRKTTGVARKTIGFASTAPVTILASPPMAIVSSLRAPKPTLSFEFFPPKNDRGAEELLETVHELSKLDPSFVSVTYGAGGTTRNRTRKVVQRIIRETSVPTVPHLTCIGHSEAEMQEILDQYAEDQVGTILALRGDPPRDQPDYDRSADHFQFASDLVSFIKDHPHPFEIGVAGFPEGHPATQNRLVEMENFKAKIDAGADYICTQLFFDNHDFLDYRDRCSLVGIDLPIVAGIMPLTTLSSMKRMADLAAGSRFPAKLLRALDAAGEDPQSISQAGIDYAIAQCQELIAEQVSGLHLYTLNKSKATLQIAEALTF
jgi:methylenetetrahydrofolate reductase (NADPH)